MGGRFIYVLFIAMISPELFRSCMAQDIYHEKRSVNQGAPLDLARLNFSMSQEMFSGLTIYWKPPNSTHITFAVRGVGNGGFVAIGFPKTRELVMPGSDAVIGWSTSTSQSINSYQLKDKKVDQVVPNSNLPIYDTLVEQVGYTTTMIFTREFASGSNPLNPATENPIIASFGSTDFLKEHTKKVNKVFLINFLTGAQVTATSDLMKIAHGSLNLIGWGFLIPFAMLWMRYAKLMKLQPAMISVDVHRPMMYLGTAIAGVAFILSFFMVTVFFNTTWHAQFGVMVYIVMTLHMITSIIRFHFPRKMRLCLNYKISTFLHVWQGRIVVTLGIIQVIGGLIQIDWYDNAITIAYGSIIFISFASIAIWDFALKRCCCVEQKRIVRVWDLTASPHFSKSQAHVELGISSSELKEKMPTKSDDNKTAAPVEDTISNWSPSTPINSMQPIDIEGFKTIKKSFPQLDWNMDDLYLPAKKWKISLSNSQYHYTLRKERAIYSIGSSNLADLVLPQGESQQHGAVVFMLARFPDSEDISDVVLPFLIDFNSDGGTYINGKQMSTMGFVQISNGDKVRFGSNASNPIYTFSRLSK